MAHVQNRACRCKRSVRVRLVLPGLPLYGVLCVLLVVGVALWPGARGLQAQEKASQLQAPPAPPPPLPPIAVPPATAPQPFPGGLPATNGPGPIPDAQQVVPTPIEPKQRSGRTRAMAAAILGGGRVMSAPVAVPAPMRFQFKIDPKMPLKDLLPVPPLAVERPAPALIEDLARVPEVLFQEPPAKNLATPKAMEQTALTIARINHLNQKKSDHFLEALLETRSDLAGLPVAMGDACRTTGERSREFNRAVAGVRQALQSPMNVVTKMVSQPQAGGPPVMVAVQEVVNNDNLKSFWERYNRDCANEDQNTSHTQRADENVVTCARIAALMQVLAPESASMRRGLVKYLAGISHIEATRALARLALFSAEDELRSAALDALKVRRERDYTAILLQGLRYPLPAVARRASEAMVKLERTDLVAQLVDVLDEPDPRAPVLTEINNKRVPVVRELVRINHHKSCLLCHAPGNTDRVSPEALTAAVPVPSEPLPSPSEGYQSSSPDLLVRVDVTYLRQDFSMKLPVADANPWPEMQRFDFLVRTRVLTDKEKIAYEQILGKRAPGVLSPYHRAALAALRELTGRDTEPTPQAWRRLLKLPTPEPRVETVRR